MKTNTYKTTLKQNIKDDITNEVLIEEFNLQNLKENKYFTVWC